MAISLGRLTQHFQTNPYIQWLNRSESFFGIGQDLSKNAKGSDHNGRKFSPSNDQTEPVRPRVYWNFDLMYIENYRDIHLQFISIVYIYIYMYLRTYVTNVFPPCWINIHVMITTPWHIDPSLRGPSCFRKLYDIWSRCAKRRSSPFFGTSAKHTNRQNVL